MRKVIILFLLLLILGIGAAFVWLTYMKKPAAVGLATYLPDSVQLLIEVPDGVTAALQYKGSDLKKVYESDEMKALFAYCMTAIADSDDGANQETLDGVKKYLEDLDENYTSQLSGTSFIAASVSKMEQGTTPTELPYHLLVGVKPRPGLADPAALLTWFKEDLASHLPENAEITETTYKDLPCTAVTIPLDDSVEFSIELRMVVHDGWFLASLGEDLLHPFIDNMLAPGSHPSLADTAAYNELVSKYTGADPINTIYSKTDILIENFFDQLATWESLSEEQEQLDPALQESIDDLKEQMEFQKKAVVEAVDGLGASYGASWFDGARLHTQFWTNWKQTAARDRALGPTTDIAYSSFEMTSPDTMLYISSSLDLEAQIEQIDEALSDVMDTPGADPSAGFDWRSSANESLSPMGLDIDKNVIGPIGNEVSYSLDWKDADPYPAFTLFIEIVKPDDFQPTYDVLKQTAAGFSQATGMFQANEEKTGDLDVLHISSPAVAQISPGLFYDGDLMGMSTNSPELVKSAEPSTMFDAPGIDPLAVSMKEGSFSYAHIRLSELTKRGYPELLKLAQLYVPTLGDEELLGLLEALPEELSFTEALGSVTSATYAHGDLIEGRSVMNGDIFVPILTAVFVAIFAADDDLSDVFASDTMDEDPAFTPLVEAPTGPLNEAETQLVGLWGGERAGIIWEMDRKSDRTFELAIVFDEGDGVVYRNYAQGVWWVENNTFMYEWQVWAGDDGDLSGVVEEPIKSIEADKVVTLSLGEEDPDNVEMRIQERTMAEWELMKELGLENTSAAPPEATAKLPAEAAETLEASPASESAAAPLAE